MRTILLVEDNEDDVFFMHQAKTEAGITNPMHVAEDGRQAIDYLEGRGKFANRAKYPLPFLVLLDLKLPLVLGLDVLKWIRERSELKTILVVVLTSSDNIRDINRAYRLGANSFMVKPLDFQNYIHFGRVIEGFWLKASQAPEISRPVLNRQEIEGPESSHQ